MAKYNKNNSERRSRNGGRQRMNTKSRGSEYKRDMRNSKADTDNPAVRGENGYQDNDPAYYFDDKQLLDQTANIGFQVILGDTYMDIGYREPTIAIAAINASPGMSWYVNEAGVLTQERDGLNLSITDLYTTLSTFSGRATSYAPQDVGALFLAMGSIIEQIEHWRRIIGLARVYNERNEALPLRLIEALGVNNGQSFASNLSLYIDELNTIITAFNTLPIFGNVQYLKKCRDIYQKVYFDDPIITGQMIALKPHTYWKIDETSYTGGTILKSYGTPTVSSPSSLNYIMQMVDAILNSSTYQVIRSDLLNVASKLSCEMWKLDIVTSAYAVMPEFDPGFIVKWHNMTVMGDAAYPSLEQLPTGQYLTPSNDVYPDPNTNMLLYNPAFARESALQQRGDMILDMPTSAPTPVDIVEATRFMSMSNWTYQDSSNNLWAINPVLSDHYVVYIAIYSGTIANTTRSSFVRPIQMIGAGAYTSDQVLGMASVLSQFGHHPRLISQHTDGSEANENWDVEYFTHLPIDKLRRMNRLMYQGIFKFRVK